MADDSLPKYGSTTWTELFSSLCAQEAAKECGHPDGRPAAVRPSAADVADITAMVAYLQVLGGGGAQSAMVAAWIEDTYGWRRCRGSLLTRAGDVRCADGHWWNVLPDGAWFDATADQFGVRHVGFVIESVPVEYGSPDHARYRWAFDDFFNPGTAGFARRFPDCAAPDWRRVAYDPRRLNDDAAQILFDAKPNKQDADPFADKKAAAHFRARDHVHRQIAVFNNDPFPAGALPPDVGRAIVALRAQFHDLEEVPFNDPAYAAFAAAIDAVVALIAAEL